MTSDSLSKSAKCAILLSAIFLIVTQSRIGRRNVYNNNDNNNNSSSNNSNSEASNSFPHSPLYYTKTSTTKLSRKNPLEGCNQMMMRNLSRTISRGTSKQAYNYIKARTAGVGSLPCDDNMDCRAPELNGLNLVCGPDHQCICPNGMCWVYEYEVHGMYAFYVYTCDTCGILGSDCSNTSVVCDPPGVCLTDGFCHCPRGEHSRDGGEAICAVVDIHMPLSLLLAGSALFFILFGGVLIYNSIESRRMYGTFCWCRTRRQREYFSSLGINHSTDSKSPSYTMESLNHSIGNTFTACSIENSPGHVIIDNENQQQQPPTPSTPIPHNTTTIHLLPINSAQSLDNAKHPPQFNQQHINISESNHIAETQPEIQTYYQTSPLIERRCTDSRESTIGDCRSELSRMELSIRVDTLDGAIEFMPLNTERRNEEEVVHMQQTVL